MFKVPKQSYTAEFKVAAVQRVKDGQGFAVVARELGMSEQTLRNWVKAEASGKLNGAGAKPVTPEQMELSRMCAEIKRPGRASAGDGIRLVPRRSLNRMPLLGLQPHIPVAS